MTRAELDAIRAIVREELAAAIHSRGPSPVGIGASGQGDQCPEVNNRGSMDPTSTETAGESSSSLDAAMEAGRRSIIRIQREHLPTHSLPVRATRRKAAR